MLENCPSMLPAGEYRATHKFTFPRFAIDIPRKRLDAQTSCAKCPVAELKTGLL